MSDSTCWPSPVSREGSCSWFRRYLLSVKNLSAVQSEREFHWGFCNYIFLIWYILSIYCVKSETSCLVLIYRGYRKRKHPFWKDRFILQGEVAHLLNQSASMEQPISFFFFFFSVYFCLCFVVVWFLWCLFWLVIFVCVFLPPTPCLVQKGGSEGSCHHPLLWGGRCGGQDVDGSSDATVLSSLNWADAGRQSCP